MMLDMAVAINTNNIHKFQISTRMSPVNLNSTSDHEYEQVLQPEPISHSTPLKEALPVQTEPVGYPTLLKEQDAALVAGPAEKQNVPLYLQNKILDRGKKKAKGTI